MEWDRGLTNRQFDCQAHLTIVNGPYLYSAIHANLQFVGHFRCNKKSHAEFTQISSLDNEDGVNMEVHIPACFLMIRPQRIYITVDQSCMRPGNSLQKDFQVV